jgi:putative CocE/NonD family hydrolase
MAEDVFIHTKDGATLSATLVLPKTQTPAPAILIFEIYTRPEEAKAQAESFAARGYAGIVADVRGKRLSPDPITPYEHEARDTREVIDWIAKQPWSNGKVGMIGSSYSGFTAWAANKYKHPALKGIAVSAAAIPGQGLPMYNNVFVSFNYPWAFYVTNNKLLDDTLYADRERWWKHTRDWFNSGRPYRELDAVDGTPNPFLQKWLQHPAYDAYWQSMVPYGREFAKIDIPVLSITGYYDDGQISALRYFKEHNKYRRNAEHYLVIGPYDHFGTNAAKKPEVLREYPIDPVAQIDTQELKLQFMDYVLRGAPKPAALVDKVNYEVMGANEWRHAATLQKLAPNTRRLYFTAEKDQGTYRLAEQPQQRGTLVTLKIDLSNRFEFHGLHTNQNPIVQGPLSYVTETIFQSAPFEKPTTISGTFAGELLVSINKRDFDLSVAVYEAMQDGKLFHLGYALQRASFASDPTKRKLLTPGKPTRVRFETTLVSRQMRPGSVLFVLLDAIKLQVAQVNYGTGKDVSDESMQDAGEPLLIKWMAGSYIDVPVE